MRLKTDLTSIIILALLMLAVTSWSKDESSKNEPFISQARSQEVWAEGTPAVKLRGLIEVSGANDTIAQGHYAIDWVSPSQWREEIRFANYQRTRIRDARGYWQKASLDYQPYLIYLVTDFLDLNTVLSVGSKETFGKVRSRQKDGIQQRCVELNMANKVNRVLCFDDKSGALLAVERPQGEHENPPELSRIEYTDFHSVAGKLIPYSRRALRGGKTIASVRIADVSKADSLNAAEFIPPSGAEFWPQCDFLQSAELAKHFAPNYPQTARRNREMGRVIMYGVVEADGTLSHMTVIKSATPVLNEASMESFRHSQYTPAQCQSNPIRSEIFFESDFQLWQ